jgi:hypothetical protein
VVILGAGLDSRAFRFEAFQHGVKPVEHCPFRPWLSRGVDR